MKNFKLFVVASVCLLALVSCESESVVSADELPAAAKMFIEKNYPAANIIYVKRDVEWLSTRFEVALDNGMEIEFDGDGAAVDIDVKN